MSEEMDENIQEVITVTLTQRQLLLNLMYLTLVMTVMDGGGNKLASYH